MRPTRRPWPIWSTPSSGNRSQTTGATALPPRRTANASGPGAAEASGNVNPKYGSEPGVLFYTHVSDQYAPFHTKVINVGVRDATYVLDGLLYHESDLRVEEHYTDTAGFTDHVFALMHLLGFRFAPRIRDLADKRLFVPGKPGAYPALSPLVGGTIRAKPIRTHWEEILRLATSIRQGTVTASLMLRKLGSYPRRTAWRWRYASWGGSSAACSPSTGCKASSCAAVFRLSSSKKRAA